MNRARRLLVREDGAAAVEFAVIGLVLIIVIIGTIEIGRALFLHNEIAFVADRAARRILIDPTVSEADLQTEVESSAIGLSPNLLSSSFGKETADGVLFRTVTIQYPFTLLIPALSDDALTLSTSRRVPVPAA